MDPIFVDANGGIALLHRADPHHARAQQLVTAFQQQRRPRVLTTAVLLELGDGFARKKRWHVLHPFLTAVWADPLATVVSVDQPLLERAVALRQARPDKDWGLTDCVSFVVMSDLGLKEALTADKHFQQAGFRALLLEP
jgi:hypothetical protein